jgi:hypothetical protein
MSSSSNAKATTMAIPMPESSVDVNKWWRFKNLRTLNLLLVFPLLSIFTQGYVKANPEPGTDAKIVMLTTIKVLMAP